MRTPSSKLYTFFCCFIAFILIIAAALMGFLLLEKKSSSQKEDMQRIASERYNGIFLSMYPIDDYSEEDFALYRGLQIVKCSYEAASLSDISAYLEAVFATDNEITNIYLGLDSLELWDSASRSLPLWDKALEEELLPYAAAHPEVSFEILFSHPSLEYWAECSAETVDLWTAACRSLVDIFSSYSNFICYFPAAQHWLIANPGNYRDPFLLDAVPAQKLMLFTFCDKAFQITPENTDNLFEVLNTMIEAQWTSPAEYPDLSDWSIVFFGDSVIGNYTGSISIPGVVSGLSGAHVYNCAKGGTTASTAPDDIMSFAQAAELFLRQDVSGVPEGVPLHNALEQFIREHTTKRRLCFVINYGLNDYFEGRAADNPENKYDISTFSGSLRTGISALREAYPDAVILLASPNFTTYFGNGTEKKSETGGILTDYVDAAMLVSDEMEILSINTYLELGIDETSAGNYLADGCHLNEEGRFLFATKIISYLNQLHREVSHEKS